MLKIAERASVLELLYNKFTRNFKNSLLTGVAGSQVAKLLKTNLDQRDVSKISENVQKELCN